MNALSPDDFKCAMRALRVEKGVSQRELSMRVERRPEWCALLEGSDRFPPVSALSMYLRALGISWAEFGATIDAIASMEVEGA